MLNKKLLRQDFAIYVLKNAIIRNKILYIHYNNFIFKHFIYWQIKNAIQQKYY